MTFKYFEKPEIFVGFRDTEIICDTCGQVKFCFNADAFYGVDEIASICPKCLLGGKLININSFTCFGDVESLVEQLKQLNPSLTDSQIQKIAKQKTTELEKTTPHLKTHQDFFWPCADGDYCKFIGYGSKRFYKDLAKDVSVEDFFKDSFYEPEFYNDYLWTDLVPDELIKDFKDTNQYGILFYVFKSINSDKIITLWDCS